MDCTLGDDPETSLHLVELGGVAGCVVDVEAGPLGQRGTNLGVLVGAVVVDNQVEESLDRLKCFCLCGCTEKVCSQR